MGNVLLEPIRNDQDHAAALDKIERLWGSEPGSPEHDRLEVLALLVDAYESTRWPIEPDDPGELFPPTPSAPPSDMPPTGVAVVIGPDRRLLDDRLDGGWSLRS